MSSFRKLPRSVVETVTADSSGNASITSPGRSQPSLEPSSYLAGEVIGDRYRLVRELGRGGMGVVWVAHSLVLGVDVAVKLIRASSAAPGLASRMAREAHAAARLGHPALVRVFDFGWTSRSDPFLVMELVQGETLSALLSREHRVPAIRAVQMLLPIVDGLRTAHDKGIIHRDIKPDNIFLASDAFGRQQPKLLDFGIAKVDQGHDGKLTQIGAVLGSPEYMSPEQALGLEEIDERTDVWSFCIVLYEAITGLIPFKKPNYNALMHAIINEPAQPTTEHSAGDAELWMLLERGLTKKRENRWSNMTELGEALALWLYEHGIKEDLSGNSIRAVWLDGALSGVRMDVSPSSAPSPAALATSERATLKGLRTQPGGESRTRAAGGNPRLAPSHPEASLLARAKKLAALGLGAATVGAAVAVAVLTWGRPAAQTPPTAASPAAVAKSPRSEPTPTPAAAAAAPPASPSTAAPSPEAPVTASEEKPSSRARTAPRPAASVKKGATPKRSHDFGF